MVLTGIFRSSAAQRRTNVHRTMLRHLAKLGGTVFGSIPSGTRREFFCLDERTWVWHEEWTDQQGQYHAVTTRYDVRPDGILKSQGTNSYQRLNQEEDRNFRAAVHRYRDMANAELDRLLQYAV